ncbi:hypothetical protein [Vallitalea okinawensis]|uniref:hypothetical protein n=1 Tax=Vallitalea okinawensis TaxID=2078660 RepID=UPI000CFD79A4|nr:hypothetical protein [Vallitalea okinawensis]
MKTIIAHFNSIDMADLAAKELKEKGLITRNIDIDYENEEAHGETPGVDDYDFFILPLFAMNYSNTAILPFFPGIFPLFGGGLLGNEYNQNDNNNDNEEVVFCAKGSDDKIQLIESILHSHSAYNIQIL